MSPRLVVHEDRRRVSPTRKVCVNSKTLQKGRSRSVFERLDGEPPSRVVRRVTWGEEANWKHDRFEGSSLPVQPLSNVFVRGLPKDVSSAKLKKLFTDAGCDVAVIKIERAPLTTAVVGFSRRDAAFKAVEKVHGTRLGGQRIRVMVWQRDETAAMKALCEQREQDRKDRAAMMQELLFMQKRGSEWEPPTERVHSASRPTMASMVPKQSVFERVS